ncbi:hypothetical protein SAMCCGM7_pB0106 (plasmid) [Sinorhizobium americanum CCGM7]|nr:hypothetical protein SAMCCGM7_pB0106 [Sinorhizobium americanum CCGM7]
MASEYKTATIVLGACSSGQTMTVNLMNEDVDDETKRTIMEK